MSETLEKFITSIKDGHMLSLYKNRIMFYKSGAGEIQFWDIKDGDAESELILFNDGITISFDKYEIIKNDSDKYDSLKIFNNDLLIATFKFPPTNRIIQNHNTFFVGEFEAKMEEVLESTTISKGDWADRTDQLKYLTNGVKDNLAKVKTTLPKEEIAKSAIDIANYAMMIYYLYGTSS